MQYSTVVRLRRGLRTTVNIAATIGHPLNHVSPSFLPTNSNLFSLPSSSTYLCAPEERAHPQNWEWVGAHQTFLMPAICLGMDL